MTNVRVNHSFMPQRVNGQGAAGTARLEPLGGEDAHLASE